MNSGTKLFCVLVNLLIAVVLPAIGAAICGDGIIEYATEQCDDGNLISDDRCSATCQSEDGSHLVPQCGNGKIEGEEECDGGGGPCGGGSCLCTGSDCEPTDCVCSPPAADSENVWDVFKNYLNL